LYFEDYFEEGKFIGLKVKGSYSLSWIWKIST
jgi:hypothetical protein